MATSREVQLWADGSADAHGYGGWAAVLIAGERYRELVGAEAGTTNNRMELTAVLEGLSALRIGGLDVTVYSDSQYVTNAFSQGWIDNWRRKGWRRGERSTPNKDLWIKLDARVSALGGLDRVRFEHVRGHTGVKFNERCDVLANGARLRLIEEVA